MVNRNDRYFDIFLEEATEQIETLGQNLLLLERQGPDEEVINELFRSAHTLKSAAAFVGFDGLSELNHRMEDLLQRIKDGSLPIQTELVNLLFRIVDRIRSFLALVSEGEEPKEDFADLKRAVEDYARQGALPGARSGTGASPAGAAAAEESAAPARGEAARHDAPLNFLTLTPDEEAELRRVAGKKSVFDGAVRLDRDAAIKNMRYLLLLENLKRETHVFRSRPVSEELESDQEYDHMSFIVFGDFSRDKLMKLCQVDMVEEVRLSEHAMNDDELRQRAVEGPQHQQEARIQSKNIKVSSEKIDYLMNNVGELVIINSGLQKIYEDLQNSFGETALLTELKGKIDQAERIARDLQSGIMKTRMIPVGLVFHRFTRPVRDLALELGKEVDLEFSGEDTELDKNIIDALGEPMLHLLRNSLDHGIESPEERKRAGKPEAGKLALHSFQSGNNIFIEVTDDGRGLNTSAIKQKAVSQGLIPAGVELREEEIYELIFHPGFSTAQSVTDISGRGVGMNVVKKMVEDFKGSIQIQSAPGRGSSFLLSFPLTLAIVSAILVRLQDEEYAFPLADVVETIKVSRDEITSLQGRDIINLRGDILPVYRLSMLLGLPTRQTDEEFPVLIAMSANRKIGFIVDGLIGKKEIVIKSLEQNFRSVTGLIGACLMGDGRIIMVLDVQGLLELAQKRQPAHMRSLLDAASADADFLNPTQLYNMRVEELIRIQKQAVSEWGALEGGWDEEQMAALETAGAAAAAPAYAGAAVENAAASLASDRRTTADLFRADASAFSVDALLRESQARDADSSATLPAKPAEPELRSSGDGAGARTPAPPAVHSHDEKAAPLRELSDEDYEKLFGLINRGMLNAGQVLSQLLGVRVDVSVPEIKTMDYNQLDKYVPRGSLLAAAVEAETGIDAIVLLIFDESTGYRAAGDLMGLAADQWGPQGISLEDLRSVLCELINIVGAGILNELSNRTGITMTPSVPDFFAGEHPDVMRWIDSRETAGKGLKILYITADFFRQDLEFLGRLFLIPSSQSLARVVNKL